MRGTNQEPQPTLDAAIEQRKRMRMRRRRLLYLRRALILLCGAALLALVIAAPIWIVSGLAGRASQTDADSTPVVSTTTTVPRPTEPPVPAVDTHTAPLEGKVDGTYAVLLDMTAGRVVAAKNADVQANPASITKVMTLLVAVENIENLDEEYTMTWQIINPLWEQGASITGLESGETVRLRDLLYGCILPSGADATMALAEYVAGSEEAFAQLMNQKAAELGCINTHFTNSSGLHDRLHKTTAMDMALIMAAAMSHPICAQVLKTAEYTMSPTDHHPDGLPLVSTLFKRLDQSVIKAGKTGYTDQARNTLMTYSEGADGHKYVYVTLDNNGHQNAVTDTLNVYKEFCGIE
ncbi:MAG: D-alanyl-D-alanine carboxypeptidase [Clostridia bacterium]|nr:D-alanyl-D-alanine carboxypeptidase [Clostridia bacterium]